MTFPDPQAQKDHAQSHGLQDKVRSTIRQFVRDWSEEVRCGPYGPVFFDSHVFWQGKQERDTCYAPCLDALEKHYAHIPADERYVYCCPKDLG